MMAWKFHRCCLRFPMMSPETYRATKEGMREYGFIQSHPIIMFRGAVIDGRHRLMIAEELKSEGVTIEPCFKEWTPPETAKTEEDIQRALDDYTMIENALRRNITEMQLAQILVRDRGLAKDENLNISQVARETGITRVVLSKAVNLERVSPDLSKCVAEGSMGIKQAFRLLPPPVDPPGPESPPETGEQSNAMASDPDEKREQSSNSKGGLIEDFKRLRDGIGEVTLRISRMVVLAESRYKRTGGSELFLRCMKAAHEDTARWARLLKDWSTKSGVK